MNKEIAILMLIFLPQFKRRLDTFQYDYKMAVIGSQLDRSKIVEQLLSIQKRLVMEIRFLKKLA